MNSRIAGIIFYRVAICSNVSGLSEERQQRKKRSSIPICIVDLIENGHEMNVAREQDDPRYSREKYFKLLMIIARYRYKYLKNIGPHLSGIYANAIINYYDAPILFRVATYPFNFLTFYSFGTSLSSFCNVYYNVYFIVP